MTIVTVTLNPSVDKTFSVPHMVPDRKLSAARVRDYPGGGGINVARMATRLGVEVHALWGCGGENGRRLARLLDAERVAHTPIPIEGETRENLIITEASSGDQYRFGLPGPTLAEEERARWLDRVRRLSPSTRYVVFSGSVPGETPPDFHADLVRAAPNGVRVVVDTKREALRRSIEVGVHLIKPNVHELEEIADRELADDDQIERAAREIVERRGAEVVVVSLGRGGALVVTKDAADRLSAPSVPIRSKVGAGDSMVGGMVAALYQGRSLRDAARLGVAAGAATVMSDGTQLGRREDAERLVRGVHRQEPSW